MTQPTFNVTIELVGCDSSTVIDTDVTDIELRFLHRLIQEGERAGWGGCEPTLDLTVNDRIDNITEGES